MLKNGSTTHAHVGHFPDPNEDESPVALDEATRSLYRRAIDNPSSLTDEDEER
jgi:hypothetical protein